MADAFTTTLNFTLPEVGASEDTWGTKLNANWSALDALFGGTGELTVAAGGTGGATAAAARTNLGLAIGSDVQAYSSVLAATTASFLTADETKLDNIEALADVTDAANVAAAGALMTSGLGSVTQAYDADILKADTTDTLTVGYAVTAYNAGSQASGTFTPNEANGNVQYCTNDGAHTLAPPTNEGTLVIQYTNGASAGVVTTSGFTKVDGDSLTTTNGDDFLLFITKANGFSLLSVKALQ